MSRIAIAIVLLGILSDVRTEQVDITCVTDFTMDKDRDERGLIVWKISNGVSPYIFRFDPTKPANGAKLWRPREGWISGSLNVKDKNHPYEAIIETTEKDGVVVMTHWISIDPIARRFYFSRKKYLEDSSSGERKEFDDGLSMQGPCSVGQAPMWEVGPLSNGVARDHSDSTIEMLSAEIFAALQSIDPAFYQQLIGDASQQQAMLGDLIGAATEKIYGRYGPKSPDAPLVAYLSFVIDGIEKVQQGYPQICDAYLDGDPASLAILYDELFSSADKIRELEIVRDIVLGASNSPQVITNATEVEAMFDAIVRDVEKWADRNKVYGLCDMSKKLFQMAQAQGDSKSADFMRLNFTYE